MSIWCIGFHDRPCALHSVRLDTAECDSDDRQQRECHGIRFVPNRIYAGDDGSIPLLTFNKHVPKAQGERSAEENKVKQVEREGSTSVVVLLLRREDDLEDVEAGEADEEEEVDQVEYGKQKGHDLLPPFGGAEIEVPKRHDIR